MRREKILDDREQADQELWGFRDRRETADPDHWLNMALEFHDLRLVPMSGCYGRGYRLSRDQVERLRVWIATELGLRGGSYRRPDGTLVERVGDLSFRVKVGA